MSVTMADVARSAGVSKATVSRIINKVPTAASSETTERVLKVIEDLGYVPNTIAASLKTLTTNTVGLIVGDIENPFFGVVIKGIEVTLRDAGFNLILANSSYQQENEQEMARVFLERHVDAMIVAPSEQSPVDWLVQAYSRGIPIVLIDNFLVGLDVDFVGVTNYKACYDAAQYLAQLGHKRLAVITGQTSRSSSTERHDGFCDGLRDFGIDWSQVIVAHGDYSQESGYQKALELMALIDPPTALFVSNNFMTVGALRAIHEKKIKIPDQISIMGFDDMYWYEITDPPLTAIDQPAFAIGKKAAERVIMRINNKKQPPAAKIRLPTRLIIRDSTAPPPR